MESSKKELKSRMLILVLVVALVIACELSIIGIFFTGKAEFKSPDGKITATFTELDKTLTFSGEGELSGSYHWIEEDPHYLDKTAKAVGMSSIKRIVFEPGITSVKAGEFCGFPVGMRDCRNLKKVVFKGNIDRIGSYNFFAYYNLSKVIFEGDCKSIGFFSFALCDIGKTADIPKGCKTEKWAFCQPTKDVVYSLKAGKKVLSDEEWDQVMEELLEREVFVMNRCSNSLCPQTP